ncbi:pyridoxal phosphate-dependent aminotransferase [Shimia abyssi]|uniref:Histidinol-phosphate aminotransferase n=1 Tax=Shimia abyssi TaxID=1662395 RepID=A0A2P8FH33_9RHOB|nr:pyridoxal phosphate-dependent aminotransferase [Shimia abyssi]PSL21017.1 histidinol-phosphate aminotransferase [Shimia abyssi]
MTGPRFTKLAQTLPATVPFVGPEAQERARGEPFSARLGANENVFGPSPKAIAAMRDASSDIWMYGDPESHDLRYALAAFHNVGPQNIVVGEGIDGLLGYLARLLIEPGDAVVTSNGAYPTFNYHVAGYGGILHKVPYFNDAEDLPALLKKAGEVGAKLVYFANPDNPMGSWHTGGDIAAELDALPNGCVLLLDEAYVELAPPGTAVPIDINDARVIRMRTFSKGYGMAGARVGYALGQADFIRAFEKIRNHFGLNRAAQAGALTALQDQAWLEQTVAKVTASRDMLSEIAAKYELAALPSATNFVAIDCGRDDTYAKLILEGLVKRGIFVRMPFVAPQNRCIRVSCGPARHMALFDAALEEVLAEIG